MNASIHELQKQAREVKRCARLISFDVSGSLTRRAIAENDRREKQNNLIERAHYRRHDSESVKCALMSRARAAARRMVAVSYGQGVTTARHCFNLHSL